MRYLANAVLSLAMIVALGGPAEAARVLAKVDLSDLKQHGAQS